jgi:NAD(P)H-flavin reductase
MDYGPESQFTGYYFSIYKGNELIDIHGADKKCKLYEEAELECLKKLIEIVKEKQL